MKDTIVKIFFNPVELTKKSVNDFKSTQTFKILGILLVILILLPVLTACLTAWTATPYSFFKSADDYTSEEISEYRKEEFEDIEFEDIIKASTSTNIVTVVVISCMFFAVSKLLKSTLTFTNVLTILSIALGIYTIGQVLYLALSYIYLPLALLVLIGLTVMAALTFIFSFKDLVNNESTDKFVTTTTLVTIVTIIVLCIAVYLFLDISVTDIIDYIDYIG